MEDKINLYIEEEEIQSFNLLYTRKEMKPQRIIYKAIQEAYLETFDKVAVQLFGEEHGDEELERLSTVDDQEGRKCLILDGEYCLGFFLFTQKSCLFQPREQ